MASASKITSAFGASVVFACAAFIQNEASAQTVTSAQFCQNDLAQDELLPSSASSSLLQSIRTVNNTLTKLGLYDEEVISDLLNNLPEGAMGTTFSRSVVKRYYDEMAKFDEGGAYARYTNDFNKLPAHALSDYAGTLAGYVTVLDNMYRDDEAVQEALKAITDDRNALNDQPVPAQNPGVMATSSCTPNPNDEPAKSALSMALS